jgi:hypothetical protein
MQTAYHNAQAAPNKTRKEEILAKNGLHDVEVCLFPLIVHDQQAQSLAELFMAYCVFRPVQRLQL